jgi:ribosomal protein L37AE/L43A
MRKRSEAVDPRQTTIPGATIPSPAPEPEPKVIKLGELPPGCEVEDNVFFAKCPDCGMNGSSMTHKRNAEGILTCFRCSHPFDAILTKEFIDKAREHWMALHPRNGKAAPAPTPTPPKSTPAVQEQAPARQSSPFEKCEKCGERITVTALGKFYPCGHDTKKDKAPAEAKSPYDDKHPAPTKPVEIVHHTPDGDRVVVHYGPELFSPKQFNNFTVGPFQIETTVRSGETTAQAMQRASDDLHRFASLEYKRKSNDYIERLKKLGEIVGER